MKTIFIPVAASLLFLAGCATDQPSASTPRKELVVAVTAANELLRFNAGKPDVLLSRVPMRGLQNQETISGIDYRVAKGWLYAIGSSGQIYRLDTETGAAQPVGSGPLAILPAGSEVGFDFNPTVDRIRIVTDSGQNKRAHPDTGAIVDSDANAPGLQTDGKLSYAPGDISAGKTPAVVAAAYTYNKDNDKLTTNFAIDAAQGTLVTQGSREGRLPAVSPNTGQLFTVGSMGVGALSRLSFDIADVSGAAFIAAVPAGQKSSSLYEVDLNSGKARLIGRINANAPVTGIAVEP